MKKLLLILLLPIFTMAQFQFVPISADYASFSSTDTSSFVQVYLSLYQGNLQYKKGEDSTYAASFSTFLDVTRNDENVRELAHNYQNTLADTTKLTLYNQFVDVYSFEIPHGEYKASVRIEDHNSKLKGEYVLDLKTIKNETSLQFSDVELCTEIKSDGGQSMFNKNGLRVIPNPNGVYDALNPLFYYYIELNNLSYSAEQQNLYTFEYFLTNAAGDTLRRKKPVTKKIAATRLVEIGGMNVVALPKGVYFFHAKAKDLSNNAVCETSKKFSVYKPTKKKKQATESELPEIANHYIGLNQEQLETEFEQTIYIATSQEKKVFKKLENVQAMQKFLTQFWNRKDKENGLAFGTFRRTYLKRIEIATEKYTSMGRKGWKTDMGRVFILYGEPDEYERHPSSIDRLPYVIWHYHSLEGGAQFIFADEEGFGQFRLLHSTYRRELQNPNWEQIITKRVDTSQSPF